MSLLTPRPLCSPSTRLGTGEKPPHNGAEEKTLTVTVCRPQGTLVAGLASTSQATVSCTAIESTFVGEGWTTGRWPRVGSTRMSPGSSSQTKSNPQRPHGVTCVLVCVLTPSSHSKLQKAADSLPRALRSAAE